MSETLERMQERARELARSGKFGGWRSVAFELQFEPSLKEVFQWLHSASVEDAFQWLHSPKTKEELDRLCDEATTRLLEAFLLLQRSREKDRARILDELSE